MVSNSFASTSAGSCTSSLGLNSALDSTFGVSSLRKGEKKKKKKKKTGLWNEKKRDMDKELEIDMETELENQEINIAN